jgi:hypothetical protein
MFDISRWLYQPVMVQGRELVLIPDVVGPLPVSEQHNYVEIVTASNACPAIAVREQDVDDVREKYPHLPVFGIWQILIHSNLIASKTLQVLPTSAWDGYYLFSDLGRIQYSGVYEAGFFAADTSFNLADAEVLSFTAEQLVMPLQPARLARELHQERRLQFRRAWSSCGLALAASLVLAFGVDAALHFASHNEQQAYLSKSGLLQSAQQGYERLTSNRLMELPDNQLAITRLAELWTHDPSLRTEQPQSFANPEISLVTRDLGRSPAQQFAWLSSRYDARGHWVVTFNQ